MPNPSTFTTVSEAQAEAIRAAGSTRKEWLLAIRAGKVIVMQNRPSLTKGDKEALTSEGLRMRTRYTNANDENEAEVYVWTEALEPAPDLPYEAEDDGPPFDPEGAEVPV